MDKDEVIRIGEMLIDVKKLPPVVIEKLGKDLDTNRFLNTGPEKPVPVMP